VVKSRLNEDTLKDIALTTGGAYVQGLGPSLGLDQVFRDHIATMERRELASTLECRYEERFQIPLALALVLLIVEMFLPRRRSAAAAKGVVAAGHAGRAPARRRRWCCSVCRVWSAGSTPPATARPRATRSSTPANTTKRPANTAKD
jgi:hypothetical protein